MEIQWNADHYDKRGVLKICVNHSHQRSIFGCRRGSNLTDIQFQLLDILVKIL